MQVVHIFPEKAHHWKGTSGASHGLSSKTHQDPDRKRGLQQSILQWRVERRTTLIRPLQKHSNGLIPYLFKITITHIISLSSRRLTEAQDATFTANSTFSGFQGRIIGKAPSDAWIAWTSESKGCAPTHSGTIYLPNPGVLN